MLSEEQRTQQARERYDQNKDRYWGAERNEKRRALYAKDAAYRQAVRDANRKCRRETIGAESPKSCSLRLRAVPRYGFNAPVRAIDDTTNPFSHGKVYTLMELASLMNRDAQVLRRWISKGIFPAQSLVTDHGTLVFALDEVTEFVRIMGAHQDMTHHYRVDHVETKYKLFDASLAGSHDRLTQWLKDHP